MFFSIMLTTAAKAKIVELGVHQLAVWIQFEGVAQKNSLTLMKFATANLQICASQVNRF
jgi:hypothetical protein